MEAGRQLGLKSHFILSADDIVVQLVPVCGCYMKKEEEEDLFFQSFWKRNICIPLFLAF